MFAWRSSHAGPGARAEAGVFRLLLPGEVKHTMAGRRRLGLIESPAVPRVARWLQGEDLDASTSPGNSAVTLPPDCYTDPDFYEFEKESIFFKEWLCLGRAEQIPNAGDFFTITMVEEPLIVVRGTDDRIRVMSAVCRHRSMIVTAPGHVEPATWLESREVPETSGNCTQFKCPYHYWTYDLEGRLVGAPEMHRTPVFDESKVRLPQFPVEIWNGFIFTNFDPQSAPLAPRLRTFEERIANWKVGDLVDPEPTWIRGLPWNWKVMHENSMEGYHADRLHAGLHAMLPSSHVEPPVHQEGDAAILTSIRATHIDYSANPSYKPLRPIISTLSEQDRWVSTFGLIPPILLIGVMTDSVLYRIVIPTGPESIDIRFGLLIPGAHLRPRRYKQIRKMEAEALKIIGAQDWSADSAVQKGLRSRFAERSPYSWQEEVLVCINRWLVSRYQTTAEQLAGPAAVQVEAVGGRAGGR
jgi:phenylpropionate dioxygenase-like ring-hydroxylating dioxygenase large terminal subunit